MKIEILQCILVYYKTIQSKDRLLTVEIKFYHAIKFINLKS